MKAIECPREQDVLDALAGARWPDRCDRELRDHVERCAICADVLTVAEALLYDRDAAWADAQVPGSGVVWWRAQMRARREAAGSVAEPMTFVQAMAIACGVAALLTLAVLGSGWLVAWAGWLGGLVPSVNLAAIDTTRLSAVVHRAGLLALAVWVVLAPVAVYLAVSRD
jgi:hypothetical protein